MKVVYFVLFILLFIIASCADWEREKSSVREPGSVRELRPDTAPIESDGQIDPNANLKDNAPLQ